MTISENIFLLLKERGMTQKEFSEQTGIAQSAISDWKRKKTNPVSNKILTICEVLDVSPYELLSGTKDEGTRSRKDNYWVIDKSTELGVMIEHFQSLDMKDKGRLLGYLNALS
ncbi:MAG: helix-turn-helix transcriptional regulator [Clostridia bacterium]|nr:helix-turn-helix transcriptional regulator [Clostridia bacterium]